MGFVGRVGGEHFVVVMEISVTKSIFIVNVFDQIYVNCDCM